MRPVVALVLLALDVWLMARLHITHLPGQTPKSLPTLQKRGDQSSSQ